MLTRAQRQSLSSMIMRGQCPYVLLGVPPRSGVEEIKSAYRLQSLLNHPDKGGSVEEMLRLQRARDVLLDARQREFLDRLDSAGWCSLCGGTGYREKREGRVACRVCRGSGYKT